MAGINLFPIRITLKCPLNCSFCVSHDPEGGHIGVKSLLAQINNLPVLAGNTILIHGGDPFLHPDILKIVRTAAEHGRIILRSPGINLSMESIPALMPYVDVFRIMTPALNPVLYRRLTGGGKIADLFTGLKIAMDKGAPVEIEIPVLPENLGHVADMIKVLANKLPGLKGLFITFPDTTGLNKERLSLWQFFARLSSLSLPWPIQLDQQTLPPPCTAPSERVFLEVEHLFGPVMKRPDSNEDRKECKDCMLKRFCPANSTTGAWANIRPNPISWGGTHKNIQCTMPWTTLDISEGDGQALACCRDWVRIEGESVFQQGIRGSWNSSAMQHLRTAIADDRRRDTCKTICPYMHSTTASLDEITTTEYPGLTRLRAIAKGAGIMDEPPMYVSIGVTTFCNLRCVMCTIEDRNKMNELPDQVYNELYSMAPGIRKITFTGGEPLLSPKFPEFLKKLSADSFPGLSAHIITNGTVLTRRLLSDLSASVLRGITISLNAATKITYESVNRGAKWEKTIRNIREVTQFIKEQGLPIEIVLSFVILRSNFQETRQFVLLAKSMGTQVRFMVNTNDPGSKSLRRLQVGSRRLSGMTKQETDGPGIAAGEWFIGERGLCNEAVNELQAAVQEMHGMAPERIADARSVLESLKGMCGK